MEIPKATVQFQGQERTVVFDFGTLVAIEEAVGKTINEVVEELDKCFAKKDSPTRMRLGFVGRFIAGCLRAPESKVQAESLSTVRTLFNELWPAFAGAISQFAEPDKDTPEGPPASPTDAGSAPSAFGPASTSA